MKQQSICFLFKFLILEKVHKMGDQFCTFEVFNFIKELYKSQFQNQPQDAFR